MNMNIYIYIQYNFINLIFPPPKMASPSPSPKKPDGFVALAFPKAKPEPTASVHLSLVKSMSGQGGL